MRKIALVLALLILAAPAAAQFEIFIELQVAGEGPHTLAPCGADPVPQIDVWIHDQFGNPIQILASDLWLEGEGLVFCPGGNEADSSTYAPDPGHTTFTGPRFGSVAPDADCAAITMRIIVLGLASAPFTWGVNSPDLDASGTVTLGDLARFSLDFNGLNPCADFDENGGSITVADFGIFASMFNQCACD